MNELENVRPVLHQQLTIRIPGRPPTANARRHWRSVARDNETWKETATLVANGERSEWESRHGLKWRPLRRCDVRITFGVHTRAVRDWDNLIGSTKPLTDGLVAASVMLDDSIRVIRSVSFGVTFSKGDPYTEFEITEIDDD